MSDVKRFSEDFTPWLQSLIQGMRLMVEDPTDGKEYYLEVSKVTEDLENTANKVQNLAAPSATTYPSTAAVATALSTAISNEATTRANADTTEIYNRQNADTALSTAISNEATTRANADTTEIYNRQNADTALSTAISNEATTRANADTTEIYNRQNADTALSTAISTVATELATKAPALTADQNYVTDAELTHIDYITNNWDTLAESLFAYGVQFDSIGGSATGTRIGDLILHKTLPIQNAIKACLLLDNGTVNYYLNPTDWTKKADGTASLLDGTDGQVMVELPAHYRKTWLDANGKFNAMISDYPIAWYLYVPKAYVSCYQGSIQRSTGKLFSCVNSTPDFRGGNNSATNDGNGASLLGVAASNMSETAFRAAARLRGSTHWNQYTYDPYISLFWLYAIEYATTNSQLPVNSALDANGYKQGGLGNGVTTLDGTKWNNFNQDNPFIKNGYTNSLGNGTGEVAYTMTFEYDAGLANYKGVYSTTTPYAVNNFVSSAENLYKCILETTGDGTIDVTNTTYFTPVTRTIVYVNRYRGIEMPFGHIYQWVDGCKCNIQTDTQGGQSQFYVCENPANYQDTDFTNYVQRGLMARTSGWVKSIIGGTYGDILSTVVGGGSTTYLCDYFYTDIVNATGHRGVLFGGNSYHGALAGLVYTDTYNAPSAAKSHFGSRLCFF